MKHFLSTAALIIALCLLAICFSSCGDINVKPNNGSNGNNGGENDGEAQADDLKTAEQITNLVGDTFYIELESKTSSGGSDITSSIVIASDGTSSYLDDGSGAVFSQKVGDVWYIYNESDGKYAYPTESPIDTVRQGAESWFLGILASQTDAISYTSKKSVTFLGRSATEYIEKTINATETASAETKMTYVIDNETGLCLKLATEVSTSGSAGNQSGSTSYEVKKIMLGSDAGIKSFLGDQAKKITAVTD